MDTDEPVDEPSNKLAERAFIISTYRVTIIMLVFGWVQVAAVMQV